MAGPASGRAVTAIAGRRKGGGENPPPFLCVIQVQTPPPLEGERGGSVAYSTSFRYKGDMAKVPLLHYAESYQDPDQYWLTGFLCPDPFLVLAYPARPPLLAVSSMEAGRARKEAAGAEVRDLGRLSRGKGLAGAVADLLKPGRKVRVLPSFPLGLARELERRGITLEVDPAGTSGRRRKSRKELSAIESVQRRLEGAFGLAWSILAAAAVRRGILFHRGEILTAGRLRSEIESFLLARGAECPDAIVAPGRGAADPHWRGKGPLRAGVPIVVDVFPRDRRTRYHSDMTRTFVKGRASPEARRMHRAVCAAQDAAFARLAAGASLAGVHEVVCALFRRGGWPVAEKGVSPARGFLHGTGHGLGLAVHEAPAVSSNGDVFRPGDVVTVEPGLYDRRIGGVRIEDVAALTPSGEVLRLTRFPRDLEVP